jgi:hypothetical protein
MKSVKLMALGLLVAALTAAGCGPQPTTPATGDKKGGDPKTGGDDHVHGNGPSGGVTFAVGKDHVELNVSHDKKEIGVTFLQEVKGKPEKEWPPLPVAAAEFTLTTKETKTKEGKVVPPMTVTLKPVDAKDGKATKFVGTDPGVGNVADFAGDVTGKIDGKPASGKFEEK